MIKPIFRFLLILLLLLAIPLRGFAASSELICIPDAGVAMQDHYQNQTQPHGHEHKHQHEHSLAEQASHTDENTSNPDETKAKCNHCAPCCLAVVLNSHLPQMLAPPAGIQTFPTLTQAMHSAFVRNLDRPPQPPLL